ncbi:hypothetical protein M3027_17405 [Geoalkalibacter halelectricus]|nr:hypothetical protein [Geoalkalibacter halelectricus]
MIKCGGNQARAAAFLQIPRHALVYRLAKYGLQFTPKIDLK